MLLMTIIIKLQRLCVLFVSFVATFLDSELQYTEYYVRCTSDKGCFGLYIMGP